MKEITRLKYFGLTILNILAIIGLLIVLSDLDFTIAKKITGNWVPLNILPYTFIALLITGILMLTENFLWKKFIGIIYLIGFILALYLLSEALV